MKIYIVTGEKSGDQHAAKIVKEIKNQNKDIKIGAWGGDSLMSEKIQLDHHIDEINYMGFWEVLKNISQVFKNLKKCKQDIINFSPDLVLLVDYPGFNLKIAEFAYSNNIKTFYYISPKIWAWNSNRISKIKKFVDKMFVVFPFEKEYYKKRGYDVKYLGNPVLESISSTKLNLIKKEKPIISLIPGSRKQEIEKILPIMLEIISFYPNYSFVLSATNSFTHQYYKELVKGYDVEIIFDRQYDILNSSSAAIVTSGTSTLEAALLNVPQIVCYKTSKLSYLIAKLFVKIKYISLVNILLNKSSISELIQNYLTAENIINKLNYILDPINKKQILNDYEEVRKILKTEKPSSITISKEIISSISS